MEDYAVGAAQFSSRLGDVAHNVARMREVLCAAKQQEEALRLLVFPELATSGYDCDDETIRRLAEPAGGKSMQALMDACRACACCIAYGFIERAENGAVYNSMAFLTDKGELAGVYRKVHLFDTEREHYAPGDTLPVFETPLGKVGMLICWDLAFPEAARALLKQGAALIVSGAAWEYPYANNYLLACKARAYENCLPLIAANRVGQEVVNRFIGHSAVYAAGGETLGELPHEQEGIVIATLRPELDAQRRAAEYPFLQHLRPDVYEKANK